MSILENCELHYCKLDPERPSSQLNKKNPTWELQIRTTDKSQVDEWRAHGITVKAVRKDNDEEGPIEYWRANLRKRSIKADGSDAPPPEVVDGDLNAIDPNTIGNGSIGNIRIYNYDYRDKETGQSGTAAILMGVQLTTHIVYTPKERDDDGFTKTETRVVKDEGDNTENSSQSTPKLNSSEPEDEY